MVCISQGLGETVGSKKMELKKVESHAMEYKENRQREKKVENGKMEKQKWNARE